jgi:hypothetical protein
MDNYALIVFCLIKFRSQAFIEKVWNRTVRKSRSKVQWLSQSESYFKINMSENFSALEVGDCCLSSKICLAYSYTRRLARLKTMPACCKFPSSWFLLKLGPAHEQSVANICPQDVKPCSHRLCLQRLLPARRWQLLLRSLLRRGGTCRSSLQLQQPALGSLWLRKLTNGKRGIILLQTPAGSLAIIWRFGARCSERWAWNAAISDTLSGSEVVLKLVNGRRI